MENRDYYTSKEVAKVLRVSEQTVRSPKLAAQLDAFKVGKGYRYPKQSLAEYIANGQRAMKRHAESGNQEPCQQLDVTVLRSSSHGLW